MIRGSDAVGYPAPDRKCNRLDRIEGEISMQFADSYEFFNYPKIVSGQCALENIASELDSFDSQKPLVITAKSITQRGLAKQFAKAFYDSTIVLGAIYDEVRHYVGIGLAREAAMLFKERGCDAIIALGNGPVVDLAKAVNVLLSEKADNLQPYYNGAAIRGPLKPLIVVPDCRFNGTETDGIMVVDNRTIVSDLLCPDTVVLDERITVGCCPECIAESGAIALAHAFTALTDEFCSPMTAAMARPALSLLTNHLDLALKRPGNRKSCLCLANAALMSCAAYANTRPGLVQSLAGELSLRTDIAKAKLMVAILSATITAMQKAKAPVTSELCLAVAGMEEFSKMPANLRADAGLEMTQKVIGRLSGVMPTSLTAHQIQRHLLEQTAQTVARESQNRFSFDECNSVLQLAWDGTGV